MQAPVLKKRKRYRNILGKIMIVKGVVYETEIIKGWK